MLKLDSLLFINHLKYLDYYQQYLSNCNFYKDLSKAPNKSIKAN